ncbi:MAG: PKD domain-containing protein [Planctomycetaceae bacterium]
MGNAAEGIAASSDTAQIFTTRIGTDADGVGDEFEGNLIGWNGRGIFLSTGNFSVKGNFVGVDRNGSPAPNSGDGVAISTHRLGTVTLGSNEEFAGNTIQYNARYGVSAFGTFSNTTPAIDGANNVISGNLLGAFTRPVLNSPARAEFNYPVISAMEIVGDQLIVEGFSRPGQAIDIYESGPTADGYGEGRRKLLSFVEGSADDLDGSINSYGPIVNGVEVGQDEGFRFRFVGPVPDGFFEGMRFSTIGQSSALDAASDRMSLFSPSFLFGELGSSLAPTIDPPPDVTLVPGDSLLQRGAFVDPDSVAWTATVNYGDGTGVRALQLLDDFQFDLEHEYTIPGTYIVTVSITDNSLLTATQTFMVTVENDTPEAAFYTFSLTSPIIEGDTATLTGEFSDALSSGSYFVDIDWGNGQTSSIPLSSSDRQFTATHVYRDDFNSSGSATASDVYEVSVTIREVAGNSDPTPAGVLLIEVQNSLPGILTSNFSSTSINEGDTVTLDLSFEDPGLDDTHEIKVDWGNGTIEIFTPAIGIRSLNNLSYTYLDTPRNGDPGFLVQIEITDDDEPLNPALLTQFITVSSPRRRMWW